MKYPYNVYVPKFFAPEELVPRHFVGEWWKYCDGFMLRAIDLLRAVFDTIYINNYKWGGNVEFAGVRPARFTDSIQHVCGRAYDLKFLPSVYPSDVAWFIKKKHQLIRINFIIIYPWGLHVDNRNTDGKIYIYTQKEADTLGLEEDYRNLTHSKIV